MSFSQELLDVSGRVWKGYSFVGFFFHPRSSSAGCYQHLVATRVREKGKTKM